MENHTHDNSDEFIIAHLKCGRSRCSICCSDDGIGSLSIHSRYCLHGSSQVNSVLYDINPGNFVKVGRELPLSKKLFMVQKRKNICKGGTSINILKIAMALNTSSMTGSKLPSFF